ncbi:MAG: polysaccharide biosynthesis protein [Pyrinomonadaceae bacterium]
MNNLSPSVNHSKPDFVGKAASTVKRIEALPWVRDYLMSRRTQMGIDALIAFLSMLLAHMLRFDGWPPPVEARRMLLLLPYIVIGRVALNYSVGIYKRVWRYSSIPDAIRLVKAATLISVLLLLLRITLVGVEPYLTIPIGIILMDFLLVILGMQCVRLTRRLTYENIHRTRTAATEERQRVLLVGAGDAGIMTVREIARRRDLGVEICGFVDDATYKKGSVIHGVTVLGSTKDLPALVDSQQIDHVIITMASASRKTIRRILDICGSAHVPVKIIPGLYEILGNHVTVDNLRPVEIEDLLGRDTISSTSWRENSRSVYFDKRILVTGAGGSIGSELCRQITQLDPAVIILVDKDENSIFHAERELKTAIGLRNIQVYPVICDLRMEQRLNNVFDIYRPHIVFHAAAHKHVPLMEFNTSEAVLNNIGGTAKLLKACATYRVKQCVLVSTDKAVNPTSVMGATKRVAELIFQAQALRLGGADYYSCVRFGNVLGSCGSVIPTFREQIRNGGPVTITHPDMVRYFMTIAEAAQLIIQAGAVGRRGEIYLLDMGEPVRVMDMAKDMIRLSGLTLGEDIDIEITGLRPGEKLKEELLIAEEGAQATRLEKTFVAPPLDYNLTMLDRWVAQLIDAANEGDDALICQLFLDMEIGFQPSSLPLVKEQAMAL